MLDRDGNEIFKRRGYIPPELFGKLLAAVIEDPSALPTFAVGAAVRPEAVAGADASLFRSAIVGARPTKANVGTLGKLAPSFLLSCLKAINRCSWST